MACVSFSCPNALAHSHTTMLMEVLRADQFFFTVCDINRRISVHVLHQMEAVACIFSLLSIL